MKYKEQSRIESGGAILTFIKEVKEGKFGKIEESSLPYVRIKEETSFIDIEEEDYYYSIS